MDEKIKPGPMTIPLPEEARQFLIHWKYLHRLTLAEMANDMKVGEQVLGGLLRGTRGSKRVQHKRIMRFVKRLERKTRKECE